MLRKLGEQEGLLDPARQLELALGTGARQGLAIEAERNRHADGQHPEQHEIREHGEHRPRRAQHLGHDGEVQRDRAGDSEQQRHRDMHARDDPGATAVIGQPHHQRRRQEVLGEPYPEHARRPEHQRNEVELPEGGKPLPGSEQEEERNGEREERRLPDQVQQVAAGRSPGTLALHLVSRLERATAPPSRTPSDGSRPRPSPGGPPRSSRGRSARETRAPPPRPRRAPMRLSRCARRPSAP